MTLLSFQTTIAADRAVITLQGELDVAGSGLLESELDRIIADHSPSTVVFDLSGLDFMDSTGLRLVLKWDGAARRDGMQLRLLPGPPGVQRVFEVTGLSERLPFASGGP